MNSPLRKSEPESILPKDILEVIQETDIEKTFDYLFDTFHINVKKYKLLFEKEFIAGPRNINRIEVFARFGKKHFEPALNKILCRNEFHPTWTGLLRYMVNDRIQRKEKESKEKQREYGINSRYKINNPLY